jgi:hypothetical protein
MTELAKGLDELDLAQYLDSFLEQGLDTWDSILNLTEPDLYVTGHQLVPHALGYTLTRAAIFWA